MVEETEFNLILWQTFYKDLLGIILPIILVAVVCFIICVLHTFFFIIFAPLLYLFVASVLRECYWYTDFAMSKISSYEIVQSYLWNHVQKPPSKYVWVKMYIIWLLVLRPAYECRIRRLSRRYHAN